MSALVFTVLGSPLPWQRTKEYRGKHLTPKGQRTYQKRVKQAADLAWKLSRNRAHWPTDARYEVVVVAHWPDAHARDIDNALKQALDSIQGVLFRNDCMVDHASGHRGCVDKLDPRLVVLVRALSVAESEAIAMAVEQCMGEETT